MKIKGLQKSIPKFPFASLGEFRRTRVKAKFLFPPLIALAISLASYLRLFDNYELETLDLRFLLRPKIQTTDEIVLVEIGEDSIEKLGRFPFDRSYHALLVKALSEYGAKAIIFDIFFSEPHEHDNELEDAMRAAGRVYLPFVFDIDMARKANLIYAKGYTAKTIDTFSILAKGEGHINIAPDIDGKFRRVPPYIRYKDAFYPYVSLLVACDYLKISQKDTKLLPGRYLILDDALRVPLDERSNMIINFSGKWGSSYKHYSYVDILQSYFAALSGAKPILDLNAFRDKICIVGLTAAGTVDLHPNPFEPLYPGVGIHAEVFNSILNKNFISRASKEMNLLILVILTLLTTLITLKTKPLKGLSILGSLIILFAVALVFIFNLYGMWLDLFVPIAVMVLIYLFFTFYKYIAEWKRRLLLESELDIARKIQESFLPRRLPSVEGIDVAASMFTARKVGGDLYDFIEFEPGSLGVMIGDVSGKGIPASLFMAMVTGEFRSFATSHSSPKEVLGNLNSRLVNESSSNLFVTIFYLIFEAKNFLARFSNGGHLPVIYLSEGKDLQFLDVSEGAPLGLMEGEYSSGELNFKKGDIFVLYTDGVTEAMNSKSEMYGRERLANIVKSNNALSSKALLLAIERDVRRFEPKSRQHDDMTLIVIKIV